MKKQLLIWILITLSISFSAKAQDSLVYFDEIQYHSSFEQQVFKAFFKDEKSDYLSLLLATTSNVDTEKFKIYQEKYDSLLNKLNTKAVSKKKNGRRVKEIHAKIHDQFLTKYEERNSMGAIFERGSYNCVSASGLYSLLFEDLSIPYSIKEKPTHVYVLTFPQNERVLVESTDPKGGVFAFSDKFKQDYIMHIAQAKIIGMSEFTSKSNDQLFDEYFFTDKEITLKQLIGVQYINEGLYLLDVNKKEEALSQFEKAKFFYDEDKLNILLLALHSDILSSHNYERIELADNLVKLSRFKKYEITTDIILSEFARISQAHLVDHNDTVFFDQFYQRIISGLNDVEMKSEVSHLYFYERGRILYNLGKYNQALTFFEEAYKLKPQNAEISRLFINTIALKIENEANPDQAGQTLEIYKKRIPNLIENNVFKSLLVNNYLFQFGQAFDLRNEKKGLKFKSLFEEFFDKELTINKNNVGRAYSLMAVYYFKKGYTSKAKSIIDEGLVIAPGNHELSARKRLIN